jgi:membrane-bound serine protease (ClpP class)
MIGSVSRLTGIAVFALLLLMTATTKALAASVRVIQLHGSIGPGEANFASKQMSEAYTEGDAGVIIDLDSENGSVDAASSVITSITQHASQYPIAVYVHTHAEGPAAAIAVASKLTVVDPGAILGNANGVPVDVLKSAAGLSGRNVALAAAFVKAESPMPTLNILPGDVATLTATQAVSNGMAEMSATGYTAILVRMGIPNASLSIHQVDPVMSVASWLSQGWVTILLIVLGLLLIIAEMLTFHSWGVGGAIGALVILLILTAHVIAGVGTWIGLALFFLGIGFLVIETHVLPGHGVSAIVGLGLIFTGFFLALGATSGTGGLVSIFAALLITLGTVVAFFLYLPKSRIWSRLGQNNSQTASSGYVASDDYTGYLGQYGTALTVLRPVGTGIFSGVKLPVVSEDKFVNPGTSIRVVEVQGSKIIVKAESE